MADDEPTREELLELIQELEPYIRHRKSCSFDASSNSPQSDYCDCGVGDVIEKADKLISNNS